MAFYYLWLYKVSSMILSRSTYLIIFLKGLLYGIFLGLKGRHQDVLSIIPKPKRFKCTSVLIVKSLLLHFISGNGRQKEESNANCE